MMGLMMNILELVSLRHDTDISTLFQDHPTHGLTPSVCGWCWPEVPPPGVGPIKSGYVVTSLCGVSLNTTQPVLDYL